MVSHPQVRWHILKRLLFVKRQGGNKVTIEGQDLQRAESRTEFEKYRTIKQARVIKSGLILSPLILFSHVILLRFFFFFKFSK